MMYNPFSLEGKTILVTGASSGIGRGVAIDCSKMGAKVIINGRNEERLQETFTNLDGNGHEMILADVSTKEGINRIVEESHDLDGIVNSAGISQICPVKNITDKSIEEILKVNTVAPILLVSSLVKNKKFLKGASIVLIASMSGVCVGNIGESSYGSTKGALAGFIKSAALELAPRKIRINTICPGLIPTNLLQESNKFFSEDHLKEAMLGRYPLKRFGSPTDVANAAIYLLSEASSWVTGINLVIDGGFTIA